MVDNFPSLYIIDGHAYSYQSFYALKSLHSPDGMPTNAVYGFAKLINKILHDKKPDYITVCFDTHAPTFRHDIFAQYKATRKPMPEDLRLQFPLIKEILSAYCIKIYEKQGFEADDLMATIAMKAVEQGVDAYLLTPDKDMAQMINDHIRIYDPRKNRVIDKDVLKADLQLAPEQLADYYALVGDKVDNIPGVRGIGPKKAVKLVHDWENLENLYQNLANVQPKRVQQLLADSKEEAFLSKKLFIIESDADIEFDLDLCKVRPADVEKMLPLCQKLGFRSFLNSINLQTPAPEVEVKNIVSYQQLQDLSATLLQQSYIIIEFDLDSSHVWESEIRNIAFAWESGKAAYISCTELDSEQVLEVLTPVFVGGPKKIAHGLKAFYNFLATKGIRLFPLEFDTLLAAYILDPSDKNFTLKDVSWQYLGCSAPECSDAQQQDFSQNQRALTVRAGNVYELFPRLQCELSDRNLLNLFKQVEIPLIPILSEMELGGFLLDRKIFEDLGATVKNKLAELQQQIYHHAGEEFNISSSQQLGTILFEKLKLPALQKTKTSYSTNAKVLEELIPHHQLPLLVLQYRKLNKLLNTYVEVFPKLIHTHTQRIHSSFHHTGTATGRISSSSPNLQNIPVHTATGGQIRKAFIAPSGHCLLTADYSQIELRILAHFSQDSHLLTSFQKNEDIHKMVAAAIFSTTADSISGEQRQIGKAINYGIIYGQSAFGLARELNINVQQAESFIDAYFSHYTGVRTFIDTLLEDARKNRYVETILQRRRYVPDINSSYYNNRKAAERIAVNTIMQGSAADIIKQAMVNIYKRRNDNLLNFKILLQIHDELIFEVPQSNVDELTNLLKEEMLNVMKISVPLQINIASGKNWQQAGYKK